MYSFSQNPHNYEIFCDSLQEGLWFQGLNRCFTNASLETIPNSLREQQAYGIESVLQYDRPDIILKDNGLVIFVLERTVEVPSGHNVGQRFGRLVAAAEQRIPVVYFGPYMAYKHGGATAGPRYMNLRLFYSLKKVSDYYNTAITTINWPVDEYCEVIKSPEKDERLIQYLDLFLSYYSRNGMQGLTEFMKCSTFQAEQEYEQEAFAEREIQNPEQYDMPPDSVEIMTRSRFEQQYCVLPRTVPFNAKIELYHVGMTYIRSDPYAGMAALYYFLYCNDTTFQILHFPNIQYAEWQSLRRNTKTYRMFKNFSYAILFDDALVFHDML